MRKEIVGIHRSVGTGAEPNSAWVSSEGIGERISEDEYRARGYLPEFENLPLRVTQRIFAGQLLPNELDQLEDVDRAMVEEWMKKNEPI
jgi:hypothetical protein